jgi:hypothetical protein
MWLTERTQVSLLALRLTAAAAVLALLACPFASGEEVQAEPTHQQTPVRSLSEPNTMPACMPACLPVCFCCWLSCAAVCEAV